MGTELELETTFEMARDVAGELAWVRRLCRSGQARAIREAHLSQVEAALSVGVSPAALSRWEAGLRVPQGEAAVRYAALLRSLLA
ncbi:MAG: helix-turn-helix domain-containing protein [Actinomycetota bacterium]